MLKYLLFLFIFSGSACYGQQSKTYKDSLLAYQHEYTASHEVVKGKDKRFFRFFPIDQQFAVMATVEKLYDSIGFTMKTSAGTLQHYLKYGRLNFTLSGKQYSLFVYQSSDLMKKEKYRDYLFVPFTDGTSGDASYGGGRYLEYYIADIHNNTLLLDFNKAYNPYCAYATGFHCPIPPKENLLSVSIPAGEMAFGKHH